jgi:hypothetical protein
LLIEEGADALLEHWVGIPIVLPDTRRIAGIVSCIDVLRLEEE